MKIIKSEIDIINKAKKRAHLLSDKVVIVSRPDKARSFFFDIQNRISNARATYKKLTKQVSRNKHLTHEIENIFDNYYIIDSAISDIQDTPMDKSFKGLVQIEKGPNDFVPRIYSVLIELLKVTDYKVDREILYPFLQAYQSKVHLSIRELSFVPFFLKIILIESIEQVMHKSIVSLYEYSDAEYWFEQIVKKSEHSGDYSELTSNLTQKYGVIPLNLSFYLLQKLSQYGPDTRPIVKWLKLNLLKQGVNISDLAEIENKRQSETSSQISNIINSLRWINQARWEDFIVDVNVIDSLLLKDPGDIYKSLDQSSQSLYRNEVVKISDRAGVYESEVVKTALRLCHSAALISKSQISPKNHIGYYLVGGGRDELLKKTGYKKTILEEVQSWFLGHPSFAYLGLIFLLDIILTFILVSIFPVVFSQGLVFFILTGILFVLNCDVVINLVNIIISSIVPVRVLYKLDLSSGVSAKQATIVVVPSMFRDDKSADELLRRLEVNYFGNANENIYYALLLDFKDSKMENVATDQALVEKVTQGIKLLNEKYPSAINRFYLFHRKRIWNPNENVFMGWERKRGKLREFNLLLRGNTNTSYIESLPENLPHIKYVLTIDEDTRLPKDSAIKLVGCIDHPLNRPVFDTSVGKVVSGYGIIQPRMTTRFSLARATAFSRLYSSAMGIDSYNGPAADVYQDLFGNSIFYGKGIYDVDIMELVIGDKLPENKVLSHDLLEGMYTRVGFATDIFLFEGFPESYKEYILRMHRWIRGDWQIIGWLKNGGSKGNKFTLSDKWKIIDNLRRSTFPIFAVAFLLFSYVFFPSQYHYSLIYILMTVGAPYIISYLFGVFQWPKEMSLFMKVNTIFDNLDEVLWQVIYRFIFLLDQAIVSLQAVCVSLYRLFISKKNLLRWQNSHEVSKSLKGTLREFIYIMLPVQIVTVFAFVFILNYGNGFYFYLTLLFWFISPFIAYQISKVEKPFQYKTQDLKLLRGIACRSARFFLELSGRDGNHLIPDHYQEEPITNSPAATSPTNIGMHLLSNLSAYDFGYISFSNMLERTTELFDSLNSLERYKGHFYNWYDIHTLQSLTPKYVSSVDSANILLSLVTLKQGILDIIRKPLINKKSLDGIFDVLIVLLEDANNIIKDRTISQTERKIARHIYTETSKVLKKYGNKNGDSIEFFTKIFNEIVEANEKIKKIVSNLNLGLNKGILASIYSSTEHLNNLLKQQTEEINFFMPFYQVYLTKPVIRNNSEDHALVKVLKQISLKLNTVPSLEYLAFGFRAEIEGLNFVAIIQETKLDNAEKESVTQWYKDVLHSLTLVEERAVNSLRRFNYIISLADKFFEETSFSFLYNKERGLFHIGYNVTYDKIDNSYYDFLASEANSISYLAILKREVPLKHWFYLGRKLVRLDMKNVLLSSWGGSLFEYLTSLLFFKTHKESLLGHTAKLAIDGHIKYGEKYGVPWGMGESAYTALDLNNNYQYQIFGHPALGFKRDLKEYLVVAPYTTVMSLAFRPQKAIANLKRMIHSKFIGRYGFYDAVDYSTSFNNYESQKVGVPARIYYAHHQGFSLQALNNQVNQDRIYSLFSSDPRVESLNTLLEEKIPSSVPAKPIKSIERLPVEYLAAGTSDSEIKQFVPISTSCPRRALISNGFYNINISNTGASSSNVLDTCLTRFREDTVTEPCGQHIYLYDTVKESLWSPTVNTIGVSKGKNKIEYYENKAKFHNTFNDIESSVTIAISSDYNAEFRTLTLTNQGQSKKSLKICSYGEVSLSKMHEDLLHPSFEKLFIKSEYWQKYNALVYSKPNKSERGTKLYFAHKVFSTSTKKVTFTHTADRSQFVIRGGSLHTPNIFSVGHNKIKPSLGYNYDPIFSFQNSIELEANETVTITYVNIFGHNQDEIIKCLKKYTNQKYVEQAVKRSDKYAHDVINDLGMSREQAMNYQILASRLLSPHYSLNTRTIVRDGDEAAIQALWRLGISGDLPILLVRFYDMSDLAMIKNILLCHKYLKHKGVAHDLILLNEYPASYVKSFEDEVDFLIRYNKASLNKTVSGKVFHIRSSHVAPKDRESLISLANLMLDSKFGTLEQQILTTIQSGSKTSVPCLKTTKKVAPVSKDTFPDLTNLKFYNGYGGFSEKEREYVLNVNYSKSLYTPSPWANIVANKDIGFVITENGSTYTWLFDSYDNRLTKRIDDPLLDKSSEIFYVRDEETGEFWNPTPLPIKSNHTYTVRHGLGYSKIEHISRGIEQSMHSFVPEADSVKVIKFVFKNTTNSLKRLSLTGFFEMSLGGASREHTKDYLKTAIDSETGSLITKNIYHESFKNAVAFVDLNGGDVVITNDREEFLGKGGDVSNPLALRRVKLSNLIHEDVDHCNALQTFFNLEPGKEIEIISLLGGANSISHAQKLIHKYRSFTHCEQALKQVSHNWNTILNKIQINTPDESINILFNERLLYQVISSRLLARTGYYQPSGAYGFRDQLQDSLSLIWSNPGMTKEIILKASRHQFLEGDGMNWWHDHNNFGIRTAFSDHQIWLPYVVSSYVEITGDTKILDERESYVKAPLLDFINNPSWAGVPEIDSEKYDIYDHCLRALERTFVFGRNGLPIIGNGDWNDGLNKVGEKGFGESVWLGWFLCAVIEKFIPYIKYRGDYERVKRYEQTVKNLKRSLEKNAWDGKWYKRAFFDSGASLGSSSNKEFKIDSISQSWSVLSHAAREDRSKTAMNSVIRNLFQDNLLLLISPAVKDTQMDPGYIRDYPAGVRENGAQYNHAALWSAQAFAELNDSVSMMKILDSVNPIKRSSDMIKTSLYRVEPYVVASDIYAKPAEAGRGGWTWYTGSAGVMYRTILENMLGLKVNGNKMEIKPCIPKEWMDFSVTYTYKNTKYHIYVLNHSNSFANFPSTKKEILKQIKVDGDILSGDIIHMLDDEKVHEVEVRL